MGAPSFAQFAKGGLQPNDITKYAYDTEDNLLSITDANGHATQFAYNARAWVTQTTFPSTLGAGGPGF